MNLLFWGLTIGVAGKVMLAVGVLLAHSQIVQERKIDSEVLRSFKIEHTLTIFGIILIIVGYGLEIYFYGFTPLLTCSGTECAALINAAFSQ